MKGISGIIFSLLIVVQSFGQGESSQAPKISAFSLDVDNLGAISNSVNLFTGDLNLPLNLISTPAKGGLSIDVSLSYNSNIQHAIDIWNLEAPTSSIGLGWTLPTSQIIVDNKMTGTRVDDEFYLVEDGISTLLICTGFSSGVKSYKTKSFSNWIINYTIAQEQWEIIKDDGTRFIYGGSKIQMTVKWGNWIGNSSQTSGQQHQVSIWNISEVVNLWGDKITFSYDLVTRQVGAGGLYHTEACYIKSISDSWGNEVEFVMGNKLSNEFMEPHAEQNEPDAYQERYEKKYLSKLLIKKSGSTYEEIRFAYRTDLIGSGNTVKRLLESVTKFNSIGESFRVMSFEYLTTGSMKGAMRKVTTPLGGSIQFDYGTGSIPNINRSMSVTAPVGYAEPQVYMSDEYIVVTWREWSGGSHSQGVIKNIKLDAYIWDGKWVRKDLGYVSGIKLKDYQVQSHQIATGKDFFGLLKPDYSANNYTLKLYQRDHKRRGEWIESTRTIDMGSHDGDRVQIAAGDNFIGISSNNGKLFGYTWNGTNWSEEVFQETTHGHATAFGHNYMLSHYTYPGSDEFTMYVLDDQERWNTVNQNLTFNNSGNAIWHPSSTFAFAEIAGTTEYIFRWDENYNFFEPYSVGYGTTNPKVHVNNSMVTTVDRSNSLFTSSHRFDGSTWHNSGKRGYWSYGEVHSGEDLVTRAPWNGSVYSRYSMAFNPNTLLWESEIPYPSQPNFESFEAAGPNSIFSSNRYYFKNNMGTWSTEELSPILPLDWWEDYEIRIPSTKYVLRGQTTLLHYRNGKIDTSLPSVNLPGYSHFGIVDPAAWAWPFKYLSNQNSFILFNKYYSRNYDEVTSLNLYRVENYKATGVEIDYPINRITINDGNGNLTYSSIEYDYSKATFEPTLKVAQYNKVTFIPGSQLTSSKPYGFTETYFFNGLTPTELGETFPWGSAINNYKLLAGSVYRTKVFDSSANLVSVTENYIETVAQNITNSSSQNIDVRYSIRPYQVINTTDGIQHVNEYTYNSTTQQLMTQTSYSGAQDQYGILSSPKVVLSYQYGWEKYPQLLQKNILTPIVQSNKTIGGITTEASVTRWKDWSSQYGQGGMASAPFDTYVFKGQPVYYVPLVFSDWNTNITPAASWQFTGKINLRDSYSGTPLETSGNSGQLSVLILDETKSRTLAQVANATFSDVAYTSFDDMATGNFTIPDGTVVQGLCKTGSKFMNLGTTGLSKSSLNSSKSYTISFWAKSNNGTVSIDGIGSVSINSPTAWTYYEYVISNKTSTFIKKTGAFAVHIDEVRLYPINASMSSYTYHPNFGITSQTDENNQTIYTDYDNFGRQVAIYNDERDVLKTFQYKIKQ